MTISIEAPLEETVVQQHKLSGKMGVISLALTVLAFSAPLTTVSGYIPVSLMFGGIASPLVFLLVTLLILIFAVGYVSLNNVVKRPGDFYAFISFGLGKSIGLGAGLMAAVSYFLILAGVAAFFGVSCVELHTQLTGNPLPWYWYALGCWLAVGILGYLHVELSAKVLSWVMLIEIVVCLAFAFGVLNSGGDTGMAPGAPFSLGELSKDNVNLPFAMLFAVSFFMGFEATALFRDEVRLAERTIPVATYGAIIFIGAIYTLCAYAMVVAYGNDIQTLAANSPATMFSDAFAKFVDGRFSVIVPVLVLTSAFAAILSIHNVLSRYVYNLSTDGALPRVLCKVHPTHSSPYLASFAVSALVLAVLLPFIISGSQPAILYGQLAGVGTSGVIILMTIVNISALTWYIRCGKAQKASFLKICVAPAISSAVFLALVGLVAVRFDLLVGGEPGERTWMLWCLVSVLLFGVLLAQFFKRFNPSTFTKLGRSHID